MIESSIIKLILIVALNMCFVLVWVKKENLRSFMPFEFIRRLEEKAFLKKVEKLISFIGNINIFWILNISYFLLIKFFEKGLNLILGFSEGTTKDLIIESNILKSSYIYANSLGGVTKFLFDSGNFIGLFIGVTALMIPIYLYIIGFKSKSKRQLLLMLTKKGDMFYISFFIYVMMFFKVEKLFLIGAIGYLIYLLMEAVKWIMKIENSLYSFKGLGELLKFQEEEEIIELYNAALNELYQGVKDNDASATDENKKLLLLLLRENIIKIENTKNKENTKNLIRTLYDIYDVAIKNQDDDIFRTISYLYVNVAKYYREKNDKEYFYWALYGMGKVYDYSCKNGTDKFKLSVVDVFRFDTFGIYEECKENFEEGIEWYSQMFEVITDGIKKAVKNNDFYFFQQFIYLIEKQFKRKKNLKKDYKLLERSVYFGVLLYLKEEKRKLKDNEERLIKIDEYIEFVEKFLSNNNIINLIELYEFIGEDVYGLNKEYRDRLNWDKIFQPKIELVKTRVQSVRTDGEKENLFFELLGKVRIFQVHKKRLLEDKYLERYFERIVSEDREKSIKRINKFKENARSLLSNFKNNRDKIDITEENYKEIEDFLIKLKNENEEKEKEKIRGTEISDNKITIFKEELEKILSESRVIKWLKNLEKYKKDIEEEKGKIGYVAQYEPKKNFIGTEDKEGVKDTAEFYGELQNRAIEQILIESIEKKKEEINSIEEALENIGGKPWIILTGTDMFSFFYEESGEDRKNIILSRDLGKEYFEKYGEILEGIYKYKGIESPIYNLDSDKEGIYILDSNDIEVFTHYNPNFKLQDNEGIEKEFDDLIEYASLKITDTKKILEKKEEEVLKYEWLQEYDSDVEKIKHFKELVLVEFNQKGELKLKENAVVYKVEFNG